MGLPKARGAAQNRFFKVVGSKFIYATCSSVGACWYWIVPESTIVLPKSDGQISNRSLISNMKSLRKAGLRICIFKTNLKSWIESHGQISRTKYQIDIKVQQIRLCLYVSTFDWSIYQNYILRNCYSSLYLSLIQSGPEKNCNRLQQTHAVFATIKHSSSKLLDSGRRSSHAQFHQMRQQLSPVLSLNWMNLLDGLLGHFIDTTRHCSRRSSVLLLSKAVIMMKAVDDRLKPRSTVQLIAIELSIEVFAQSNITSYGQRAFSYAGPHAWNSLPEHLRQTTSIDLFKRSLKTFLFGQISRSAHLRQFCSMGCISLLIYLFTYLLTLSCKDSDSDSIYCLANVYLAVLNYTIYVRDATQWACARFHSRLRNATHAAQSQKLIAREWEHVLIWRKQCKIVANSVAGICCKSPNMKFPFFRVAVNDQCLPCQSRVLLCHGPCN